MFIVKYRLVGNVNYPVLIKEFSDLDAVLLWRAKQVNIQVLGVEQVKSRVIEEMIKELV